MLGKLTVGVVLVRPHVNVLFSYELSYVNSLPKKCDVLSVHDICACSMPGVAKHCTGLCD